MHNYENDYGEEDRILLLFTASLSQVAIGRVNHIRDHPPSIFDL